jgi:hypothetical protein
MTVSNPALALGDAGLDDVVRLTGLESDENIRTMEWQYDAVKRLDGALTDLLSGSDTFFFGYLRSSSTSYSSTEEPIDWRGDTAFEVAGHESSSSSQEKLCLMHSLEHDAGQLIGKLHDDVGGSQPRIRLRFNLPKPKIVL